MTNTSVCTRYTAECAECGWVSHPMMNTAEAASEGRAHRCPRGDTMTTSERRAPIQRSHLLPAGTISWDEHLEVHAAYERRYGRIQSAERIAERGGFGHGEVYSLTGHAPRTFEPKGGTS